MTTSKRQLQDQVARFRRWADALAKSQGKTPCELRGEWEFYYEDWESLYQSVFDMMDSVLEADWDGETIGLLLYVLARDNETERIATELTEKPEALLRLAKESLRSSEDQARWQVAAYLSRINGQHTETRSLLESLAADEDEYVRRRALLSLGKLGSPLAERLADAAWETGNEYQRMAVLEALRDLRSPRLADFLARAEIDGRKYLMAEVVKIRDSKNA